MTPTKPVPIKMTSNTHHQLKVLAAVADLTQGELLQFMVDSLESRMNRLVDRVKLKRRSAGLERNLIRMLFALDLDTEELSKEDIEAFIESVNRGVDDADWTSEAR